EEFDPAGRLENAGGSFQIFGAVELECLLQTLTVKLKNIPKQGKVFPPVQRLLRSRKSSLRQLPGKLDFEVSEALHSEAAAKPNNGTDTCPRAVAHLRN